MEKAKDEGKPLNASMEVLGALIYGFFQACINLKYIAGEDVNRLVQDISPTGWYPLERYRQLGEIVARSYSDAAPILERVGEEMMSGWYHMGPGKEIVKNGVGFLTFQTSSEGYQSVVKGPMDIVGNFSLETIDVDNGTAIVVSSTPFDRNIERGVLIGGMKAPGDLSYVNVVNEANPDRFEIEFS